MKDGIGIGWTADTVALLVFDTNAVIAAMAGTLREPLPSGDVAISIITEMELLCFPNATDNELRLLKRFISEVPVLRLDERIKIEAIAIRREFRLKLPDAIVAATAVELGARLVTRDRDFQRVDRLRTLRPRMLGEA